MKTLNKQMSEMIKECCGLTLTATLNSNFWVSINHKQIAYSLQCDKCDKDYESIWSSGMPLIVSDRFCKIPKWYDDYFPSLQNR